ncbi:sulfite exporter TauE/SafE family protein [Cupriavidus metallidurans]|uniref:sulfite exporter TauE/SafE family protein n=1 Tax=Cupriavidus metallidurans TaxID=119219 RepID=UPI000CE063CE|nr:sulfite exporter TauE/SafE family protein [Cupriavidus metallidurans]AVA35862.1 sulfite exporter TauE/SafE family protein [Cupriavidus metallidurans]
MLLSVCLGAAIGAVLGLTGAGGGVLAVPALMLGLGMTMTGAAPVALIAVGAGAMIGSVTGLRQGLVRYKAAILMACFGSLCAPIGVWLAHRLPATMLVLVFCAVMLLIAARMLSQTLRTTQQDVNAACLTRRCVVDPETGRFRWNQRCLTTLIGIGSVAGLFTGMLGVGGGFLIVPAFRQFSNMTMQASTATSLAVIALVSSSTVAGTLLGGVRIPAVGWVFIAATVAGMLVGRSLAGRLPAKWLQVGFALIVLLVALVWLARILF